MIEKKKKKLDALKIKWSVRPQSFNTAVLKKIKRNTLSIFEKAGEMAAKPSISQFKLAGCGDKYW